MIVITIVTNSIDLIPIWHIYIPLSWGLGNDETFYFGLICYNFFKICFANNIGKLFILIYVKPKGKKKEKRI